MRLLIGCVLEDILGGDVVCWRAYIWRRTGFQLSGIQLNARKPLIRRRMIPVDRSNEHANRKKKSNNVCHFRKYAIPQMPRGVPPCFLLPPYVCIYHPKRMDKNKKVSGIHI